MRELVVYHNVVNRESYIQWICVVFVVHMPYNGFSYGEEKSLRHLLGIVVYSRAHLDLNVLLVVLPFGTSNGN